jgi:ABC-type sugar transport system permease subunit
MSTLAPTEQSQAQTAQASLKGVPPRVPQPAKRGKFVHKAKLLTILYFMMLPTIAGMLMFTFYPQFSAIKFSLFNWDGDQVQEFIWFKNFREAFFEDRLFWQCFALVGILLCANLVKMWPSIITAVVLHRIKSEKSQYIYRVLFVIPMIIPGLVMLLMWKNFYDPTIGILNIVLNKMGIMALLNWLDGVMPAISQSAAATVVRDKIVGIPFAGAWGLLIFGIILLSTRQGLKQVWAGFFWWGMVGVIGFIYFYVAGIADNHLWVKIQLSETVKIPIDLGSLWRVILRLGIPVGLALFLSWLAGDPRRERAVTIGRWIGGIAVVAAALIILGTMVWTTPIQAFDPPAPGIGAAPSWLGNSQLIIPALIFWGFPWIGTVGVLIYLAGLESITTDVYEAAELDGVGTIRKFFSIELPLIMTQVRINLIFMTIGTLSDYGLVLLLLGPDGGPGNKGLVPGLYAYRTAFIDQRFGYACALGMVMFFIILFITIVYQKYVRVEK